MQEDINQKTVALVIKTGKLTGVTLSHAMKAYLNHQKQNKTAKTQEKHGKTTVKKLLGKDEGAKSLEISNDGIKSFNKVARKYNIDYAIKKDTTEKDPKYIVLFKGRDTDVISMAFKEYVKLNEKMKAKPSLRERLGKMKELVDLTKGKALDRQKQLVREQSR